MTWKSKSILQLYYLYKFLSSYLWICSSQWPISEAGVMIRVARRLPFRYFERRKKSNKSHEKNNGAKPYFFIMRKVWYHQIWIQNYLGFIVSDLVKIQVRLSKNFDSILSLQSNFCKELIRTYIFRHFTYQVWFINSHLVPKVLRPNK